jgi:membrane protease subunit (stomatin/prohibitin family)
MGLFHDLRREFIACPDEFKGQIIYKWPDEDIRKFSQVTVEADELAVFFRDGRVQGTLQPGRYTLDSSLFPFLADLIDAAAGGNMFKTELYFVATHEFADQVFGGVIDNVTDPQTSLAVGLRVYGDYSMKVVDPQALIVNYVGSENLSNNEAVTDWAAGLVLKVLRTDVVDHIVANAWPILGIAAHTDDLERETLAAAQMQLAPYGLQVVRMGNFTISISDEDQKTIKDYLRDATYTKLAGGFTQYGAGEALRGIGEGAAKGEGGTAESPALLGIGVGLANLLGGMGVGRTATAPAPAPGFPATGVVCTQCGASNAAGAKFCAGCGNALAAAPHCSECGAQAPAGAKFCPNCGGKL